MSRLPAVGGDAGTWGQVLNDFLSQSHNADGSLKAIAVQNTNTASVFSPISYGAVGDGKTDDTAAVQACVAAAVAVKGIVDLGTYVFKTSQPIVISSYLHMRSSRYGFAGADPGGGIINTASDIFTINATAVSVFFENCYFIASAGHIWNASNGPSMAFWKMLGVTAIQNGASYAIWYQVGGGWIDCLVDDNCFFQCSGSATVSPWSVLRAPGTFNSVKFSRMRCLANNATVPFFNIDPGFQAHTDSNVGMSSGSKTVTDSSAVATDLNFYVYNSNFPGGSSKITAVNPGVGYTVETAATATVSGQTCLIGSRGWDEEIIFDHITWELCKGGAIWATGVVSLLINMCAHWDTAATSDIYHFETSKTGYPCRSIIVRGGRGGAVTGGANNFYADAACTNILLDSFGQGWATPAVVNSPASQTTIVNPNVTSSLTAIAPGFSIQGINSAVAAGTRIVGATTSGAPNSGTYLKGDVAIDQTGFLWICTAAGSPGTWVKK